MEYYVNKIKDIKSIFSYYYNIENWINLRPKIFFKAAFSKFIRFYKNFCGENK